MLGYALSTYFLDDFIFLNYESLFKMLLGEFSLFFSIVLIGVVLFL